MTAMTDAEKVLAVLGGGHEWAYRNVHCRVKCIRNTWLMGYATDGRKRWTSYVSMNCVPAGMEDAMDLLQRRVDFVLSPEFDPGAEEP